MASSILRDIRLALRVLLRSPGFTAITVITLAVAIGANTAIFSVVNAVLLEPLPYPDADELVQVDFPLVPDPDGRLPFSDRGYWHFHDKSRSYESFGGYVTSQWPLTGEGAPLQLRVGLLTNSAFEALGVAPLRGRLPSTEEGEPNGPQVAILSYGLWQDRFGGDPSIVGRTIDLNGVSREVIGVMPASFAFPEANTDLWVPLPLDPTSQNFGGHYIRSVARLADGVTLEAATAEGADLVSRFGEAGYGPAWLNNVFTGKADVHRIKEDMVGEARTPLLILLGTVGFVLLIACSNVANLFLVRAEGRNRETAVRTALGAGRRRLVQYVLTESLVLAVVGGLAGVLLAWIGVRVLVSWAPVSIPRLQEIGLHPKVLGYTLGISVFAGLLFGLLPALRVGSLKRMVAALRDGGRGSTTGKDRNRARSGLVVIQVALALVLLVGSGLMVRSFQRLRAVDPGFQADGLVTFRLSPPPSSYPDAAATSRFYDDLLARLEAIPSVSSAAGINSLPLTGGGAILATQIEEFPTAEGDFPPAFAVRRVTPGYFATMGIPVVEGREFDARDHQEPLANLVISASLKGQYWPDASALGRRIAPSTPDFMDVVGVVGDVRDVGLDQPTAATIYLPMRDSLGGGVRAMTIAVRTSSDPLSVVPDIRREITALDPDLPIIDVQTMSAVVGDSMSRTSFTMTLLALAALVALFLGSVGIYGVISYVVNQRRAEMGIRLAMGAGSGDLRGLVLRQGMGLAVLGIVIGLVAAGLLGRVLTSLLFGVSPFDPLTFAGGSLVFLAVAALACLIPAQRAASVQPAVALRQD